MKSTDPLRNVNLKCPFPDLDGPPMSVDDWATKVFGVEKQTVSEWIKTYSIRHKAYGQVRMIRPIDMWECVPYVGNDEVATDEVPKKQKRK